MDLIQEAKKSNKQAYNELVSKYNHIFYKTARIYLTNDVDIDNVFKIALAQSYREIVNVKTEDDFLIWTLRLLIQNCLVYKRKVEKKRKNSVDPANTLQFSIGDKITTTESDLNSAEYIAYRRASVVEEYVTSIDEKYRLIAVLYYYANLTPAQISKITKESEFSIKKSLDSMRITIYEMIKNKEVDL